MSAESVRSVRSGCQPKGMQVGGAYINVEDVLDLPGMREALTELASRLAEQDAGASTSGGRGTRRYVVGYEITRIEVLRIFGADPSKADSIAISSDGELTA